MLPVDGMKMWHAMLAVEHADHDAEESGEFRHSILINVTNEPRAARHDRTDGWARRLHLRVSLRGYSVNISCNVSSASVVVADERRPRRLTRRSRSTVRS